MASSSFAATMSCSVQVGDLNNKESEIIADNIKPAMLAGISMLFSLNNLFRIVAVQPTGSARKYNGSDVSKFAIR